MLEIKLDTRGVTEVNHSVKVIPVGVKHSYHEAAGLRVKGWPVAVV